MGLLVLSRKKDESIVINDDIIITIVDIRGDKCRIGIEAPKMVPVHRLEVYNAIHRERAQVAEDVSKSLEVEPVVLVCKPKNLEATMKLAGLKSLDTKENEE